MLTTTATSVPFDLLVEHRRDVGEDLVEFTLASVDGSPLPPWSAGAHLGVDLRNGLIRQYSLCGDPGSSKYRIAVLREAGGRGGSLHLHDRVHVGSTVRATGPTNHFVLQTAGTLLFIAGGIGITPLLPMMSEAEERGVEWTLYYTGRRLASMAYAGDLVSRYGEKIHLVPRDTSDRIPLADILAAHASAEVYCCGPESLIQAVEGLLGDEHRRLHVERFVPIELDSSHDSPFDIVLDRRGCTLHVGASETILEVVEREGVRILSSCREGTCGTCETGVLAGQIDHRDSVLSPDERDTGDVMMICVSRSKAGSLVLDL